MKIKQKKELNLPQLIEWGFNNPELVKGKLYLTKEHDEYSPYVQFSVDGYGVRTSQSINNKDTFTVEVEEEVREDTVFNYLLLTYKKDNDKIETHWYEDKCKKSVLSQSDSLMYVSEQLSITYFDDKGIPHLIWTHDKGLVE